MTTNKCRSCPAHNVVQLVRMGVNTGSTQFVVALAGNPNTGKSTVFNALTGLRQHTGNWPGKTVTRAEGGFLYQGRSYKLVDLPGTYSLLATSTDEEIARDFVLFGQPDVTLVVVDATRLERNLNLALQVMEITDRVVVCLNLMDEARQHGLAVDAAELSRRLGVPVVATSARFGEGIARAVARDRWRGDRADCRRRRRARCQPGRRLGGGRQGTAARTGAVDSRVCPMRPGWPRVCWTAIGALPRRCDSGELAQLARFADGRTRRTDRCGTARRTTPAYQQQLQNESLPRRRHLRWKIGAHVHQSLTEETYARAAAIADAVVRRETRHADARGWDQTLDRLLTNRWTGFPIMVGMLAVVLWLTVTGANAPSAVISSLLIDTIHPLLKSAAAASRPPLVARRRADRRLLSGHGLGGERHAAADGDLLSALHPAGGFRLLAARGLQSGQDLPALRCTRQAGVDHVHGIRLQRRRCGGGARDRQSARAADCDHLQQLFALQRTLADADSDRHDLRRCAWLPPTCRGSSRRWPSCAWRCWVCRSPSWSPGGSPARCCAASRRRFIWNCPPTGRRVCCRRSTRR